MSSSAVMRSPSRWSRDSSRLAKNLSRLKSFIASLWVSKSAPFSANSRIRLKTELIFMPPALSTLPFFPIPRRLPTVNPPIPAWQLSWPASIEDIIWTYLSALRLTSSQRIFRATTAPSSECRRIFRASSLESPGLTPLMLPFVCTSRLKSYGMWAQKWPDTGASEDKLKTSRLFSPWDSYSKLKKAPLGSWMNFSLSAKSISSVA